MKTELWKIYNLTAILKAIKIDSAVFRVIFSQLVPDEECEILITKYKCFFSSTDSHFKGVCNGL